MFNQLFKIWQKVVSPEGRDTIHGLESAFNGEPKNRVQAEIERRNEVRRQFGLSPMLEASFAPRNASAPSNRSIHRQASELTRKVGDVAREGTPSGLQLTEEQTNILKELDARKPTSGGSKAYQAWRDEYKQTVEQFRYAQEAKEISYNEALAKTPVLPFASYSGTIIPQDQAQAIENELLTQKRKEMDKKMYWGAGFLAVALGVWYYFKKRK